MKSCSERTGRQADFAVRYRFLTAAEGGRLGPPYQHTRWDFMYQGDNPDGVFMVWPEFVTEAGAPLPEGEVPKSGKAVMFIVNPDMRPIHEARLAVGVQGHFMEGSKRVAVLEVCELLAIDVGSAS